MIEAVKEKTFCRYPAPEGFSELKQLILEDLDFKEIAESTFLVQLSSTEAFCYSVVESLVLGTKVIATKLPVYEELGIDDKYGILCELDMNSIDIDKIKEKYDEFKYTPPKSNWGEYLSKNKKYDCNRIVNVRLCIGNFTDVYEKRHFEKSGVMYETVEWRASYLESKGYVEICD